MEKPRTVELLITSHAVDILFFISYLYSIRHTICKLPNISEVYNCFV